MKKLISLLLAGSAIVALSGCSSATNETPENSVDIEVLGEDDQGYLVTGIDGLVAEERAQSDIQPNGMNEGENEIWKISFCSDLNGAKIEWRDGHITYPKYDIVDSEIRFRSDDNILTTNGKLEVGEGYTIEVGNGLPSSTWTIYDIEKIEYSCDK